MTVRLRVPTQADDLYGARVGEDIDPLLPLFQGDIFENVPLDDLAPPADERDFIMLITHPCSMRGDRAQYLPQMEAIRVRRHPMVSFSDWPKRAFEVLPLPELDIHRGSEHYAAYFYERGLVDTAHLNVAKRRAHLSLEGVISLQQRLTHETTRVIVDGALIESVTKPPFDEIQLAYKWNDRFIDPDALTNAQLDAALATEAAAFDRQLSLERKVQDQDSDLVLKESLRGLLARGEYGRVDQAMTVLRKRRGKPDYPSNP